MSVSYPGNHKMFYEALKEGKLLGLQCDDCHGYTIPPGFLCKHCGSDKLKKLYLTGKGIIKSYTVIRVPPEGFLPGKIVLMVELKEGPWLIGNLDNIDPGQELETLNLIDKEVEVTKGTVIPPDTDPYSADERVAITFCLARGFVS